MAHNIYVDLNVEEVNKINGFKRLTLTLTVPVHWNGHHLTLSTKG